MLLGDLQIIMDDMQILEAVQCYENKSSSEETSKINSNPEEIIDIDDINSSQESAKDMLSNKHGLESGNLGCSRNSTTHKNVVNPYSKSHTQLFEKFYRRCMKLDNNDGMKRVLERKLLPAYHNTEEEYLKSKRFLMFLDRLRITLKTHEHIKFSIVKELTGVLMNHQKKKKRIQPITLSKGTEKSTKNTRKRTKEGFSRSLRKRKINNFSSQSIINLDDDDDELIGKELHNMDTQLPAIPQEVPVVNPEVPNNNLEVAKCAEVAIDNQYVQEMIVEVPSITEYVPHHVKEVPNSSSINNESENDYREENNLLAVTNHRVMSSESENESQPNLTESEHESQQSCDKETIKFWETKLEACHKKIKYYEEQEVDFDSPMSPYILVENWKARSVNIYKKLCELNGSRPSVWKPKQIRLQVKKCHPPGPARLLEQWLNLNMDGGHYVLPDLSDVIQCVEQAVIADGLDWTKTDIIKEARSLFIQCGTTIQKYRQQREWKDLVMTAEEALDPADEDPSLQAKLENNRRIAKRKENDLLEHYTNLELGTTRRRKSNETAQNSSNTKLKSKENNNCYITKEEAKKSNLQERNTINPKEKNTQRYNITETITSNMSETLVDSTTPELDDDLIRLNNPDDETSDDNHEESFIKNYDNDVCRTSEGADVDISDGYVDSTTSVFKENDNDDVTTDLDIKNNEYTTQLNDVMALIEENIVIKQEVPVEFEMKVETSDVVDGTADFVKQYGHITEADIIQLKTIIFSNEPTVIIDISDSDSETDGVTTCL